MKLQTFLSEQDLTYEAFGARIGTDRKTIWRYAQGLNIPSPSRMKQIVEATGGAVQPQDFYADDEAA